MKQKIKPFSPCYNLDFAEKAKKLTTIPIISVGGFRSGSEMISAISKNKCDLVSLCRPFLCEVDFIRKIKENPEYISQCTNCNSCAVMCDSGKPTLCYRSKNEY